MSELPERVSGIDIPGSRIPARDLASTPPEPMDADPADDMGSLDLPHHSAGAQSIPISSSKHSIARPHEPPHASPPPPRRYGIGLFGSLYGGGRGTWRHVYQRHCHYFQDIQKALEKLEGSSGISQQGAAMAESPEPSPPSPPRSRRLLCYSPTRLVEETLTDLAGLSVEERQCVAFSRRLATEKPLQERDVLDDVTIAGMVDGVGSSDESDEVESSEEFDESEEEMENLDAEPIVTGPPFSLDTLLPSRLVTAVVDMSPKKEAKDATPDVLERLPDTIPTVVVIPPSPPAPPPRLHIITRVRSEPTLKSALRSPLSPPATDPPIDRKSVRFNAAALQHICVFKRATIPSDIPSAPRFTVEDRMEDLLEQAPVVYKNAIFCCNFPPLCPFSVSGKQVRVERVYLDGRTLMGTAQVKNLAFQKRVIVRYTTDNWTTFRELDARYHGPVPNADGVDRFLFMIGVADQYEVEKGSKASGGCGQGKRKVMFFAVRYEVAGTEFWDNNDGMNYEVEFAKVLSSDLSSFESDSAASDHVTSPLSTPTLVPAVLIEPALIQSGPRRVAIRKQRPASITCPTFNPPSPDSDIFCDPSVRGYCDVRPAVTRTYDPTRGRYAFEMPEQTLVALAKGSLRNTAAGEHVHQHAVAVGGDFVSSWGVGAGSGVRVIAPAADGASTTTTSSSVTTTTTTTTTMVVAANEPAVAVPSEYVVTVEKQGMDRPLYADDIQDTFALRFSART
ncbi:hypothetical protein HK104_000055 [Borealophlyctis nickersoniae]|nr:hypothetical protein HK104_000055 [Borealophlyctis nickersoniae]